MLFNIFYKGMDKFIKNPNDIEGNWNISKDVWQQHSDGKHKNFTYAKEDLVAGIKIA